MTFDLESQQGPKGCPCKTSSSHVQQFISYRVKRETEKKVSDDAEKNLKEKHGLLFLAFENLIPMTNR